MAGFAAFALAALLEFSGVVVVALGLATAEDGFPAACVPAAAEVSGDAVVLLSALECPQ